VWNFAEIYAELDRAHGAQPVVDGEELASRAGAWLENASERTAVVRTARETVAALGGGLERTLAALEPYLMQIRLERRADHA
jgi:3-deoxy-D-manno-octulosonic-acid transferase